MPPVESPTLLAVQWALLLCGAVVLWRKGLSADARKAPRELLPWSEPWGDFFLFLWLVFCGVLVTQFAATHWLKGLSLKADSRLILDGVSLHAGMLGGILLFKLGFAGRDGGTLPGFGNPLLTGAATFLAALPVVYAVGYVWQNLLVLCGIPAEPQELIRLFAEARSPGPLALMIVLATVIAPVTEEIVFRAGIFRYLRTRLPRWAAILAPACIFGAVHFNLESFAPLVTLGVIFSLAYERTGRITTTIVAHGLFNLFSIGIVLAGVTE